MRWCIIIPWILGVAAGQRIDVWDLPPLRYSESTSSDRMAVLAEELADGAERPGGSALERLRWVLHELEVPESSQVLVFSKTSKQIRRIGPKTPRAIYFSDRHYVGYVPGGAIEVIAQDPVLGPVFYLVDGNARGEITIERDRSDCFSCHGTTRTEGVPGMLVRSVFPDAEGRGIGALGSETVDHRTAIADRWGGYYVTGSSSIEHRGNRVFGSGGASDSRVIGMKDLGVDFSRYPRATSDVVALVVLEHQVHLHNLLTAASIRYRRAAWLARALDPEANPDEGQAGEIADSIAEKIVAAMLFRDEADLGEGIEGDPDFQQAYAAAVPRASNGRSLADFRLYRRIFKLRCSCMIYSPVFDALPPRVRGAALARLRVALEEGTGPGEHLSGSERRKITAVLDETLPGWRGDG